MQELPELEIYRALLAERFAGATITAIQVHPEFDRATGDKLEQEIVNKTVWFVERRAELVVFHLDNGKRLTVSLTNDASLYVGGANEELDEQATVILRFDDRCLYLFCVEAKDVALLSVKELEASMKGKGPDPLDKRLSFVRFVDRFAKKRSSLKTALVDPNILSGIGPVYSDEIMFEAKLRPEKKLTELEPEAWERLYAATGHILRDAISHGGVRVSPLFASDSFTGGYRERLHVHGLDGEPCKRCGGTIKKVSIAGRKSYCCPDCQK
ncbi:zinc finger domain-containing protein [Paenibacillus sp. LHD-117]|uniref:Fpg/Nei family DNA glycosylase n=1 Tax=Paenibacillus sp. LHD-117 TaxID=3071412 RepID=UPI0027DF925B|nr:DNA-formamidopyrimidine glycosylase family protein [Paenibacillus sp. LHD-117]MDQ6418089.1 zinc finger domain-containing protein [Paenibacillus sp. LHD-117]